MKTLVQGSVVFLFIFLLIDIPNNQSQIPGRLRVIVAVYSDFDLRFLRFSQ